MKPETAARDDSNDVEADAANAEVSGEDRPAAFRTAAWPSDDELPVAPAAASTDERSDSELTQTLRELLNFHLYGKRPDDAADEAMPMPALLHPYRDLSRIRYEYPVCLNGFEPDTCALPLSRIVDNVLAAAAPEGDEGEQMKRSLYRLESVMRSVTEREPGERLSVVWERAATSLRSTSELSSKKKELQREQLKTAREGLEVDGELVPCSADTVVRLFRTLAVAHWRERAREASEDVATLIQDLKNILITDFQHSEEALRPERLRESLGAEAGELDAAALSDILSQSPHADPLPKQRRDRVQKALATLVRVELMFTATVDDDHNAPFTVDRVMTDCAAAAREHEERMRLMVDFFKSMRIARLETSNGYRESVHDGFFKNFSTHHMTAEEFALCPPVLLHLTRTALGGGGIEVLVRLLAAGTPVKVLLSLDDLCGTEGAKQQTSLSTDWAARLAGMAMALGEVYVLQAPVSRFSVIRSGMLSGFGFDGPAFFSVYTGDRQTPEGVPTYLTAAAATESRVFPIFEFNPAKGPTLADRMNVCDNPQSEEEWTSATMRYLTAAGEEQTQDLLFTPADFLCFDQRLARHFWCVTPDQWHDDMVPLGEYLEMNPDETSTKTPYILAVDEAGVLERVVVTRELVLWVARSRALWLNLRESGGIDNSFANNLLATEKKRLDDEMQEEIDGIEQRYASLLEQDVGELTREIVQRIANRLMSETGDGGFTVAPARSGEPAPQQAAAAAEVEAPVEPEVEAPVEEAEEEEEVGGLDDAYIDTPLCTTCNECTQLNAQIFAYNSDKQAYVKNPAGGPYQDIVRAAELCPVHIIHPGKPKEAGVPEEWIKRAAPFN